MTDVQMITIAIAILAVFAGTMFNNTRIGDMNKRIEDVNRHIDDKFDILSQQMNHLEDNIIRIVSDHEEGVQKLEGRK